MKSLNKNCAKCGNKIKKPTSRHQQFCSECHNNHSSKTELKGGSIKEMSSKKKSSKTKTSTASSSKSKPKTKKKMEEHETEDVNVKEKKKVGIVELRKQNAQKILDYMKDELNIESKDITPTLSRAGYIYRGV